MSRSRRKPRPGAAHYLAPAAFLAAVTVAVLLVHSGLSHRSGGPTTGGATTGAVGTGRTGTQPAGKRRFYVVRSGDTFGSIAAKEGIPVARLQALNPHVSSNALRVGQRLRIR